MGNNDLVFRRYERGVSPLNYDFQAITGIISRVGQVMEPAIDGLRAPDAAFPHMRELELDAVDVELIYRQCSLAVLLGLERNWPVPDLIEFVQLYARVQTLILNNIDTHLDLSGSYGRSDAARLSGDVRNALCYVPYSVLSGIALAKNLPGERLWASIQCMARTTRYIIECIHDDYHDRFNEDHLTNPLGLVRRYADPVRSRHLGSGFYLSTVESLNALFGQQTAPAFADVLGEMRILRQRVDELADLRQDIMTGLVTYPVALALWHSERAGGGLADLVRSVWVECRLVAESYVGNARESIAIGVDSARTQKLYAELGGELVASPAIATCVSEAETKAYRIVQAARRVLPAGEAECIEVIVNLKRAFLDRLVAAEFEDLPPPHSFEDMRTSVIGKITYT